MATGDQADCLARIKAQLPPSWFGNDVTPILDALLNGPAWVFSWLYSMYAYAVLQLRISTATDGWLDLAANDFFGKTLLRQDAETDATYKRRILTNLLREHGTIPAISDVVADLTQSVPVITEPSAYNVAVTVSAGAIPHAEILAAIESVRPICCTVTTTFV